MMMRWVAALILLLPVTSYAQTGAATGMSVTATGGVSRTLGDWMAILTGVNSKCVYSTHATDGCDGAQTTGNFQAANFFYGYLTRSYAQRPAWNVAGVDYPVGYSGLPLDATVGGNRPACLSYNGTTAFTVDATSADCTVNGLDFEGRCVTVNLATGHTATITNSHIWGGPGTNQCEALGGGLLQVSGSAGSFVGKYNYFDGANNFSASDNISTLIKTSGGTKNLTLKYNVFYKTPQSDIEYDDGGTATIEYNYAAVLGVSPNHGDFTIDDGNSGHQTWVVDYNTVWGGDPVWGDHTAYSNATAMCYLGGFSGVTIDSAECQNNTLVTSATFINFIGAITGNTTLTVTQNLSGVSLFPGMFIAGAGFGNPQIVTGTGFTGTFTIGSTSNVASEVMTAQYFGVAYPIETAQDGPVTLYTVGRNWIDKSGAFGYMNNNGAGVVTTYTCTGNKDLPTGSDATTANGGFVGSGYTCN